MRPPTPPSQYTLCCLVPSHENSPPQPQISPAVWKTILELRYLDIPFKMRNFTFSEIQSNLKEEYGASPVSVPILINEEGEMLRDSWDIALYLEENHAKKQGKSLFSSDNFNGIDNFKEWTEWCDGAFKTKAFPPILPRIYASIPPSSPSAQYFLKSRFGSQENLDEEERKLKDEKYVEEQYENIRQSLKKVNDELAESSKKGYKYIAGKDISHLDFSLFGRYLFFVQFVPEMRGPVWEHESLGHVKEWLGTMRDLGLLSDDELMGR